VTVGLQGIKHVGYSGVFDLLFERYL